MTECCPRRQLPWTIIFALALVGCASQPSSLVFEVEPSVPPSQPSKIPGLTFIPSPQADPSPTIIPTLSFQQQEQELLEQLNQSKDCSLPCWWNLTPGRNSWNDAQQHLGYLNIKTTKYASQAENTIYSAAFDFAQDSIYNRLSFLVQKDVLQGIKINSFSNNPSQWKIDWANFSPAQIASKYGEPDRVWLETSCCVIEPPKSAQMGYTLWFFYDKLGFLITYNGLTPNEPTYKICPVLGKDGELLDELDLFLIDPKANMPLEKFADVQSERMKYIKNFNEATGLDTKHLFNLLLQKDKQPCFDTPQDIWP